MAHRFSGSCRMAATWAAVRRMGRPSASTCRNPRSICTGHEHPTQSLLISWSQLNLPVLWSAVATSWRDGGQHLHYWQLVDDQFVLRQWHTAVCCRAASLSAAARSARRSSGSSSPSAAASSCVQLSRDLQQDATDLLLHHAKPSSAGRQQAWCLPADWQDRHQR
jgi:hypothetical protein